MALATDWTIARNDPGMAAVIHVGGNVLSGAGSLELKYVSGGSQINLVRTNLPKRFLSGRARFLWSRAVGALGDDAGWCFCQSQDDLTGGAGTAYFVAVNRPGSTLALRLYRCSAGLTTKTLLSTGSTFALPTLPESYPIEVQWRFDPINLGGMAVLVRHGALANYQGVTIDWSTVLTTTDINYLDSSGFLTSTQGEGPAYVAAGTGTSTLYYFDEMSAVPLLVGGITT